MRGLSALPPCSAQVGEYHHLTLQVNYGTSHTPGLAWNHAAGIAWSSVARGATALVRQHQQRQQHCVLQCQVPGVFCLPIRRSAPCCLCAAPLVLYAIYCCLLHVCMRLSGRMLRGGSAARLQSRHSCNSMAGRSGHVQQLISHPLLRTCCSTHDMMFL